MGADREEVERIISLGISLLETQREVRASIRKKWKKNAGRLLDAHCSVLGVTASLLDKHDGEPVETTVEIDGRLALTASFVQGIDACEVSISEGLYVQAANLLKQEMETVSATIEFREGTRKKKKSANVKNLPWGLATLFGRMNDAAHVADNELLNGIISSRRSAEIVGATTSPQYNEELAFMLYGLQVSLMMLNALEISILLQEMYDDQMSEDEARILINAFQMLVDDSWLEDPMKEVSA